MPPTNDFVPFCNENTGTNLPTQSAYLANPNLPIGNQPGIASSSFNNKPLRQATTIAAILAQFTTNQTGADMLDNQNTADHALPAALLAALTAGLKYHSPVSTSYLSSSGNHNITFKFQIATGSATAAATYSDGTTTYTVKTTIASGTQLDASGGAVPAAVSGTLTKLSGTGDATLTYYAYRKPLFLRVLVSGGGGGGGGSGSSPVTGTKGGTGGTTTFGTSLLTATGGTGGDSAGNGGQGAGGTSSVTTSSTVLQLRALTGGDGTLAFNANANPGTFTFGGAGGVNAQGGGGGVGGQANTGSGGAGGRLTSTSVSCFLGHGGGAGGYLEALLNSPLATYAYSVGAAGTAGAAATSGQPGIAGGTGIIIVEEHYQ